MNKIRNVLSLFDGMSCGQIALNRAGIEFDNYYASELDKYAINIAMKNYPKTIQLGDVNTWLAWNLQDIDLLIGGSPCQGFSFAGKQLNFKDERSSLFFQYVNILQHYKTKYFLLENVKMKKEYEDIITGYLGVQPIKIDSAIVSAQHRERIYWTNIPNFTHPINKGLLIKDITQDDCDLIVASRGRYQMIDGKKKEVQQFEIRKDFKSNALTTVAKDNYACRLAGLATDIKGIDILKRIYHIEGKSPTLTAVCGGHQEKKIALNNFEYRKLTPIEYERLQTVEDNYTEGVSNGQRYKMLGNGWTVDVVAHIFKGLI